MSAQSLTGIYFGADQNAIHTAGSSRRFIPPVHPAEELKAVEDQILASFTFIPLDESEYIDIVRRAASEGWIGGRIHDAIHLQCAGKMKCDRVYTFDVRHFRAVAPAGPADKVSAPWPVVSAV